MALFRPRARGRLVIRVYPQLEYVEFDNRVRQRGARFLADHPGISGSKLKNFWTHAAPHLHRAYGGICAYTAMYLTDQGSVDHYLPKDSHPELAYEWSNYRLASSKVNSSKGNATHVIDPFTVEDDWFILNLPSCLIKAGQHLPRALRTGVNQTISTLGLNKEMYAEIRCDILQRYALDHCSIDFLRGYYPFLSKEIERQGLTPNQLRSLLSVS